ncbi:MAG: VOC family protein [Rhizobiales bacterium]|nr:VOC family protein [Hyphomicrobiales bacterium]OJY01368.1 MAG: glyoxalase [Rhizobiales bacterium 63-22]
MNIAHHATGLQHIGIPTKDIEGSEKFYTGLGFETIYRTQNGDSRVIFLKLKNLIVEIWEGPATGLAGAIDHIAIDVTDVDAVFRTLTAAGLTAIEGEVRRLPFWENGVRYFTISGPNAEKLEFIQML